MESATLDRQQLKELADCSVPPAVSLYLPTHRTGRETRQDPIRLKNLLKAADHQLESQGHDADTRAQVLAAAEQISEEVTDAFWRNGSDGLALLMDASRSLCFKLPVEVPEVAAVGPQFVLGPLVRYLQGDGHYYVLAASQNSVRLMAGDKRHLRELEVESLPSDFRDALNIDEFKSSLQYHSHSSGTGDDAIYHGHGAGEGDDKKKQLLEFFHRIDKPLGRYLQDEQAPLLFAGVEYLFPIFQQACSYDHLLEVPLPGNPDDKSAGELHQAACQLVEPHFKARMTERVEQFGAAQVGGLGSDDPEQIETAAEQGQVATLLVAESAYGQSLGTADEQLSDIAKALSAVLKMDGEVFVCDDQQMPGEANIAAIYRYKT